MVGLVECDISSPYSGLYHLSPVVATWCTYEGMGSESIVSFLVRVLVPAAVDFMCERTPTVEFVDARAPVILYHLCVGLGNFVCRFRQFIHASEKSVFYPAIN